MQQITDATSHITTSGRHHHHHHRRCLLAQQQQQPPAAAAVAAQVGGATPGLVYRQQQQQQQQQSLSTQRRRYSQIVQMSRCKSTRSAEYKNLCHVVPSLRHQRDIGKVEVVTEATRYIDHLHKTLIERFILCGIPDTLKDILGTNDATKLGTAHIMRLVTQMATQTHQQQQRQIKQTNNNQDTATTGCIRRAGPMATATATATTTTTTTTTTSATVPAPPGLGVVGCTQHVPVSRARRQRARQAAATNQLQEAPIAVVAVPPLVLASERKLNKRTEYCKRVQSRRRRQLMLAAAPPGGRTQNQCSKQQKVNLTKQNSPC